MLRASEYRGHSERLNLHHHISQAAYKECNNAGAQRSEENHINVWLGSAGQCGIFIY